MQNHTLFPTTSAEEIEKLERNIKKYSNELEQLQALAKKNPNTGEIEYPGVPGSQLSKLESLPQTIETLKKELKNLKIAFQKELPEDPNYLVNQEDPVLLFNFLQKANEKILQKLSSEKFGENQETLLLAMLRLFATPEGWQARLSDPANMILPQEILAVVENMVKNGFDVKAVDLEKNTPLHHAAGACLASISKFLISTGAAPNAINNRKATPSACAMRSSNNSSLINYIENLISVPFLLADALERKNWTIVLKKEEECINNFSPSKKRPSLP